MRIFLGGPPGIGMSPRMNPPRGPGMGPMPTSYGPGMRGPPPGGPMPPGMGMSGGRPQWQPNTSTPMNYSSSSPGNYGVCIAQKITHCTALQIKKKKTRKNADLLTHTRIWLNIIKLYVSPNNFIIVRVTPFWFLFFVRKGLIVKSDKNCHFYR